MWEDADNLMVEIVLRKMTVAIRMGYSFLSKAKGRALVLFEDFL